MLIWLRTKKALLGGAFFVAVFSRAVLAECELPPMDRQVRVERVIDGDTLLLADGERVRLIGVNTPEIGREGRADEPGAREARVQLEAWIQGRTLGLTVGLAPRDHYGRLLGHLSLAGESIAERLLEQGLGFAVSIGPDRRLSACLFAAESRARQAHLGLWRHNPVQPAEQISHGGFALVSGRVTRVDSVESAYFVELDDHLVVKVPRQRISAGEGRWLISLRGSRVEVRGWVVDRGTRLGGGFKRWLIRLDDLRMLTPSQS